MCIQLIPLLLTSLFNVASAQELNDVSILLPLPKTSDYSMMLSPTSKGSRDELLPHDVYRFFPVLTNEADQENVYQYNLKVVGIRLDPCFHEGNETVCRRQIRLVWQPLVEMRDGHGGVKTSTLDTAVHTFHQFAEAEWSTLYRDWMSVMKTGGMRLRAGLPLQVHPRLQQEGYQGDFWKNLKTLILKYCGDQNLIRATTMTVRQKRVWAFVGFDRKLDPTDGKWKWTYIQIPTINLPSQSFFLSTDGLFNLSEFIGGFGPVPVGQEAWFRLSSDSKKFKETQSEQILKLSIQRAFQLENPRMHNPGTADCVSCHMAQTVRLWGERSFPQWDWKNDFASSRFAIRDNLENRSVNPGDTNRLRAFGYFDDEPIFSQRVVNETAAVVDFLKKH